MKEIFQGNITKETADLIKELSAGGGGSTGVVEGYSDVMLDDYDLYADKDISSYLPEPSVEDIPVDTFTDELSKALVEAVDGGVNFYVWREDAFKKATLQCIYSEEDPSVVVSLEITSDALDTPDYWVATDSTMYESYCITMGDDPGMMLLSWNTEPQE